MKNFKQIIYLFLLSIMIVSCGEDGVESVTNFGEHNDLEQVKVSFKDSNDNAQAFEGDVVSYRLGMPTAIDGSVSVVLEVTSSDGNVEANFTNPIVLLRGQSEVIFDFTPTDDGLVEPSETYTIKIKEINVTFVDGSTKFFVFNGDNTRTLTVSDIPTPVVTIAGDVDIVLTWGDASRDMDLYVVTGDQNLGGTIIDSSLGFTTTESVTMPGSTADGTNSIYINQFAFTANVDYTMTLNFPDGQQRVYNSTVTQDSFVFTLEKSTAGSVVTYVINEL